MNRFAHHASMQASTDDFALVQTRYVAVPALLWGVAMAVVVAIAVAQGPRADATDAPIATDPAVLTVYGA